MSIRRTGFPVLVLGVAAMLVASPVLAQNINIDVGTLSLSPSAAYGAGAGQPGNWTTVIANITTPQPLSDINGVPTTATLRFLAANGDFNFNNVGTTGDDQALMDDGGDMGGTGATDTILIEHLNAGAYTVYTYAWAPDNAAYITSVNVNGQGLQNVGGPWPGAQTAGITYATHTNVIVPADGTITIVTATVTTFSTLNGFQLVAGANDQGRCCDLGGGCAITTEVNCAAPNIFAGLGTNCAGDPCRGGCCDSAGICEITGIGDCPAPSIFAGFGTNCVGDPCRGRCCTPAGDCSLTTEVNCPAPNTFGGLGTNCAGDPCRGRCCDNEGLCEVSGPGDCAAPSVFGGLGTNCLSVNTYGDPNPIPVVMPLGGAAPPSFITVADSVIIQDLDVYVLVQHTWRDDAVIRLQGPDGTIVPLTGTTDGICGGEDNINAIFDDEGAAVDVAMCANPALGNLAGTPVHIFTTPVGGLSLFDGQNAQGVWTLLANDIVTIDAGSVLDWALLIDSGQPCPAVSCTCFGDMNGDSTVNGRDITPFAACVASGGAGCPCGDMNHAGGATSADVTAFVNAVITSTCGAP